MPKTATWLYGQQARLAAWVGITPSYLSEILHRKKVPSSDVAIKLAAACSHMEIPIGLEDWVQSKTTTSSWFSA